MRILWREMKKKPSAFSHIRVSLAGKTDTATCVHCSKVVSLDVAGRTRQSVLLQTARLHYYKHKLDKGKIRFFLYLGLLRKFIYDTSC